jgi:MFS transporter, DHA3 family, macrolide efflux protein
VAERATRLVRNPLDGLGAPDRPLALLARRDFRHAYAAIAVSELGDAFQYIALMWFALDAGGPLGVLAVRLADSVPALLFGLHGGVAADRWDRKRTMIAADLIRAAVLVPIAVAGLAGHLPLGALVAAAFVLTAATSYFDPAYGALVPALVERRNVQPANGLVRATAESMRLGGWGIAAALLAFLPISGFFALNATSFLLSALLLAGIRRTGARPAHADPPRFREGIEALRPLPALAAAVVVLGVAVTISSGTWIVGVPQLVRSDLGLGAGAFSLVVAAYAAGAILSGAVLARRPVRRKAVGSMLAWLLYLPAYGLFAVAGSLGLALLGGAVAGMGQGAALVLVNSAAQESVPDGVLGRVSGLISLVHRGAHATGLLLVAPFFAVASAPSMFAAAALAIPLAGAVGATVALVKTARPQLA